MKTLHAIAGLLLASWACANPIVDVPPVMWNSLDSLSGWTQGEEACFCQFPGGSAQGIQEVSGWQGGALQCALGDTPGLVVSSTEFRHDCFYPGWSSNFPSGGGMIDFWISMGDALARESQLEIVLFHIQDGSYEYSLAICDSTAEGESGFILKGGNGFRAVSSTDPGVGLAELFPSDGGLGWHHLAMTWNRGLELPFELALDSTFVELQVVAMGDEFPESIEGDLELLELRAGPAWLAMDLLRVWSNDMLMTYLDPLMLMREFQVEHEWDCMYYVGLDPQQVPASFLLPQNAPNPFNPATTISFTLPREEEVELGVYNLQGELVQSVIQRTLAAGEHSFSFDGSNLASGVYFYRLVTPQGEQTRSMTLIK